jgi:hypothetical protein
VGGAQARGNHFVRPGPARPQARHDDERDAAPVPLLQFEEQTLPGGKSSKGCVRACDGPIHVADAAPYLTKHEPELGIKDPCEFGEAQWKAALELLRAQRRIVGKHWHDAFVQIDDFTNEGVAAGSIFTLSLTPGTCRSQRRSRWCRSR